MKVVSVCNQKGGVGKTTLAFHLGWGLFELGHRVLMIDNDPQGSLSVCFDAGPDDAECPVRGIYNKPATVEWEPVDIGEGGGEESEGDESGRGEESGKGSKGSISIIASNNMLAGVEWRPERYVEFSLKQALKPEGGGARGARRGAQGRNVISGEFDFVVIDCPPSLGVLTAAAFNASDFLVIPTLPDPFSLRGLADILANVAEVRELKFNLDLRVAGIAVNQATNTNVSAEAISTLLEQAPAPVFENILPKRTVIEQAMWSRLPVWRYQRTSDISGTYMELIKEIEAVMK